MLFAVLTKTTTTPDLLADYPRWLVALGVTVVLVIVLWVGLKLLRLALWLLMGTVVLVGLATVVWLLLE